MVAKATIKTALEALYAQASTGSGLTPSEFADEMANIIHNAILSVQVNSGIPVSTTGTAAAQTGATTGVGSLS